MSTDQNSKLVEVYNSVADAIGVGLTRDEIQAEVIAALRDGIVMSIPRVDAK